MVFVLFFTKVWYIHPTKRRLRMKKTLFICSIFLAFLIAASASADIITLSISTPNSGVSAYPAPYADVTVNRTSSTTATITFAADLTGGYQYHMGGAQATDVNVNATTFTVANLTNYVSPTVGSGNADGFGKFNLTIDNFDGATSSKLSLSFDLTDTSGTWASASDVLTPDADGYLAAAHIFVTGHGLELGS